MRVKNKLKEIIKCKGLKQKFIANKVEISVQYLSNIINNRDQPTLFVALKICQVLEISIEEAFYIE